MMPLPLCVFVGPELRRFVTVSPGVQKQIMAGWVHVLHYDPNTRRKQAGLTADLALLEKQCAANGWRFFQRGEWEGDTATDGKTFAAIKRDVWQEINAREALAL